MPGTGEEIWSAGPCYFEPYEFTSGATRSHSDRSAGGMRIRGEGILWLGTGHERDREAAGLACAWRLLVRVRLAAVAHRRGTKFSGSQEGAPCLRSVSSRRTAQDADGPRPDRRR